MDGSRGALRVAVQARLGRVGLTVAARPPPSLQQGRGPGEREKRGCGGSQLELARWHRSSGSAPPTHAFPSFECCMCNPTVHWADRGRGNAAHAPVELG
eukprot:scaffold25560_cov146-Isochrysis_galbana.AAC.2